MSGTRLTRRKRREARRRAVAGVVAFVAAVAIGPLLLILDGGSPKRDGGDLTKHDALGVVRAAIGQTVAPGSYEMDTETHSTAPRTAAHCGPAPCGPAGGSQFDASSHGIVNFEPSYVTRIESESTYGTNVLWVTPTNVWLLGATGNPVLGPGQPLSSFARSIIGALGPSPGALAAISLAVPGGHLNLQEEAVATATPAGEGNVEGTHVTYYDVTIDMARLADVPGLSAVQHATVDYALPLLRQGGYTGTTERIGVGDDGYIREVTLTNHFTDGSTSGGHHVLSNFGCAPKLIPPDAGGSVTPVPCPPRDATPTTTRPAPTSTSTAVPPSTVPPTSAPTTPSTAPTTTTAPAPSTTTTSRP